MTLNVLKVLKVITFDPKCNTGPMAKSNKFLPDWGNVIEVLSVIINLCFNSLLTWM